MSSLPGAQPFDRYGRDVLATGRHHSAPVVPAVAGEPGLVVECATSGWCGEIISWDRTATGWAVVLEDRRGRRRLFPAEPAAFLLEGQVVTLHRPRPQPASQPARRTASGSVAAPVTRAKVARASRIWVEGTHDAQLVEKIWGDDLREVGVVVEQLGGIDDLLAAVSEYAPSPSRRLVVLVDHLVPGSKESRIAAAVHAKWEPFAHVLGHPYVDVWQAVRPQVLGLPAWPEIPRGQDWKTGICQALGWNDTTAAAWRRILGQVNGYQDLEPALLARVEQAIDLVTETGLQ